MPGPESPPSAAKAKEIPAEQLGLPRFAPPPSGEANVFDLSSHRFLGGGRLLEIARAPIAAPRSVPKFAGPCLPWVNANITIFPANEQIGTPARSERPLCSLEVMTGPRPQGNESARSPSGADSPKCTIVLAARSRVVVFETGQRQKVPFAVQPVGHVGHSLVPVHGGRLLLAGRTRRSWRGTGHFRLVQA